MKKAMFAIVTMAATVFACGCPCGIPKIPCCWVSAITDLLGLLGTITLPA
jgi:hypothetical protein